MKLYLFSLFILFLLTIGCEKKDSNPSQSLNPVKEEFHTGMIVGRVVIEQLNRQSWSVTIVGLSNEDVYVGKYPNWNDAIVISTNSDGYYQSSDIPIGLQDVWISGDYIKNLIVNENIVTNVPNLIKEGGSALYFYGIVNELAPSKIYAYFYLSLDNQGVPIIGGQSPDYELYNQKEYIEADVNTHRYSAMYASPGGRRGHNIVFCRYSGATVQYYVCTFTNVHNVYNLTLDFSSNAYVTKIDLP